MTYSVLSGFTYYSSLKEKPQARWRRWVYEEAGNVYQERVDSYSTDRQTVGLSFEY